MTDRQEVYDAINGERYYQDARWGVEHDSMTSLPAFALYLSDYCRELTTQLSRNDFPKAVEDGLNTMRKIAALAVACMEQHGVVHRGGHTGVGSYTDAAKRDALAAATGTAETNVDLAQCEASQSGPNGNAQ